MPAQSHVITQDERLIPGPVLYKGGNLLVGAGGAGEVLIYDGHSTSGDYLDNFRAAASEHDIHFIDDGIYVKRAIYVDLGDNVRFFNVYLDYNIPETILLAFGAP